MPFTIEEFIRIRPYVYHLTARSNRERIVSTRTLDPASDLFLASGQPELANQRRRESVELKLNGEVVLVRDQSPLHQGNIAFEDGWSMVDVIQELNARVFFWPGKRDWAISYAHRHFGRYSDERPVVLRIPFATLLEANANHQPEFCRFNSGSPRCSSGRKSPRGHSTFLTGANADFGRSQAVEVTFRGRVTLPDVTDWAYSYNGPWRKAF